MFTRKMILGMIVLALVGGADSTEAVYPGPARDAPGFFDGPERFGPEAIARGGAYKERELLVRFAPKANGKQRARAEKQAFLASIGAGNLKRSYHIVPGLIHVKLPQGLTVENALKRFKGKGEILYAEPNYEIHLLATPNDPNFSDLWGMHNTGQTGGTADADIDAPEAWDIETDANEIVVAVIDSGVDYTHPDLVANMWTDANGSYGYDFVNDDNDPMDDHGHGTHCAGTIGAVGDNNTGVVGVCWKVQIMALKSFNSSGWGDQANCIAAIEYAIDNGADILSNSWGGDPYNQALNDAIEAADANGVLFVASAGNDSTDNDNEPHYPSSYDCNNVIAVLATDHNDQMSGFSCYGPNSVDLGAPGSSILSCQLGGGYTYKSGTSMAAPHVAGACALVWSEHPSLSHTEVKNLILEMVDRIDSLNGLCLSNGRLNLCYAVLDKNVINTTQDKGYDTIQGALDEANDLDVIRVHPGTYYETIDFNGVSCTLRSINRDDPCVVAATIIDANNSIERAVIFESSEDAGSVLSGFTLTGGAVGIYCYDSSPTIRNCVITGNGFYYAGGIWCLSAAPTVHNCLIKDNDATWGGGMTNSGSSPAITDCKFENNSAEHYGGAIYNYSSDADIANCIFTGNTAGYSGGAIDTYQGDLTAENCIFYDNQATSGAGGAMLSNDCSLNLTNCVFSKNSAGNEGGGAMFNHALTSTLTNCTFSKNSTSSDGGAMKNTGTNDQTVVNCIYWDDSASGSGDEIYNQYVSSEPNFSYCDIEGCGGSASWDPNVGTDGGSNIDADPCFVDANDPNGADDIWANTDDGLVLDSNSPCTNTGDDAAVPNDITADIKGEYRIMGDAVDMGAYEFYEYYVYYVDVNGDDSNGTSWTHAFTDINSAVTAARGGDEIWIAKGTYVLTDTIIAEEVIRIYGGFDATETQRNQRDWQNNVTTVDGNDTVRCFYLAADATFDGLTITKGYTYEAGGGIYNYQCDPNLANCTFSDNEASNNGGAMCNQASSPTITNCIFTNNESGDEAGAILNRNPSNPLLTDCTFTSNSAPDRGGAISNWENCDPTLTNCVFNGNSTDYYGGGIYNGDKCDSTLTDCIFTANSARYGGGMYNDNSSDPTLTGSIFCGNAASKDGGGMFNDDCTVIVDDCVFAENTASYDGGGMSNEGIDSTSKITSCVFWKNSATDDGGGMANDETEPAVINCTFFENEADDDGGAIYNDDSDPTIVNCIFWQNSAGGSGDEIENDGTSDPHEHDNFDDDPDFVDETKPAGTDNIWGTSDDGLNLDCSSDCINEGDPDDAEEDYDDLDIKGSDRELDSDPEIGAYEVYYPSCWNCLTQCHGDADCSGTVNSTDHAAMMAAFFESYGDPDYNPCADFNKDGNVNFTDLSILTVYYDTSPDPNCDCGGTWQPQ
ncbi:MAG: S8 family serine peptidase [Planctomycetota bacterium]